MNEQLAIAAAAPDPLTGQQRVAFLAYVREHPDCSVREAADHVGAKRKQIRHLKATDEQFAADYRDARGYGDETIRDEIRRRAIEGVVEPVFGSLGGDAGTGIVGERRVYSDRLLGMMAKAHLPEYRDTTRLEHTGAGGGPLEVSNPDVAAALDRFTSNIRRLAERAAEPSGAVRQVEPAAAALPPGGASD